MPLAILFHLICAQHVSDINISIIRSLRLCCWITTLVVWFLVRCVLEFRCGWVGVVSVLKAEACNTVRDCIHDRPPLALILNQMNTVHNLEFGFLKIHCNIFLTPAPKSYNLFLSFEVFLTKPFLYLSFLPRVPHTPAHLIFPEYDQTKITKQDVQITRLFIKTVFSSILLLPIF